MITLQIKYNAEADDVFMLDIAIYSMRKVHANRIPKNRHSRKQSIEDSCV